MSGRDSNTNHPPVHMLALKGKSTPDRIMETVIKQNPNFSRIYNPNISRLDSVSSIRCSIMVRSIQDCIQLCEDSSLSENIPKTISPGTWSYPETKSSWDSCWKAVKRGRPKAVTIPELVRKGYTSDSDIKCSSCFRTFPRKKSLQAHERTHTKEKPFVCDFPSCNIPFAQSGHLRSHQRIHTGEKPFLCSVEGCDVRHTHSNRHCHKHPNAVLVRVEQDDILEENLENKDELELQWLYKLMNERKQKKNPKIRESGKRKTTEEGKMNSGRRVKKMKMDQLDKVYNYPDQSSRSNSEEEPEREERPSVIVEDGKQPAKEVEPPETPLSEIDAANVLIQMSQKRCFSSR